MLVAQWLEQATTALTDVVSTARLDAELLLAHVLQQKRTWVLAHGDHPITKQQVVVLNSLLARRYKHEPIAYILGKQEFYGRDFIVNAQVLVPRPESETMIDLLKTHISELRTPNSELRTPNSELRIIDVGTGSGALIITAALELSQISDLKSHSNYYGLDIDHKCLEVARRNAEIHKVEVVFLHGNLLEPLFSRLPTTNPQSLCIMANLPYVPDRYTVNESALQEPRQAIFGGADGLDLYRKLFSQISNLKSQVSSISVFTESLPFQHSDLQSIAHRYGFREVARDDFIQVFSWT